MSSSQEVTRPRGLWFLTLFAAEEIPAAMVTYVALLMLLQLGLAPAEATFCSALLFVPWVLKSFMRPWVSRVGHFRLVLHFIEALLFISLLLLAFSFRPSSSLFPDGSSFLTSHSSLFTFLALLLVSLLCAWHELAARMYYERMLRPAYQRLLTVPKLVCSQIAIIFTYGALIFLVGTLEVYFRQIRYSWSVGCYVTAGILLFFAFIHLCTLSDSNGQQTFRDYNRAMMLKHSRIDNGQHIVDNKALSVGRSCHLVGAQAQMLSALLIFLLLLPQALMFHARVLYLYDTQAHGGLQCTIQEIGFAQGTVGVIAFSVGIALGRTLIIRHTLHRLFWPMALSLVLSPFVYLGMTLWPPQSLPALCCCTMTAQFLFGLGLSVCRLPISTISGPRYRNTINMLQIPLVSAAMIVPMALSGWMVEQLGYNTYFLVNALSAPVCLLGIFLLRRHIRD
ncbi:MAG: hypothetical protein J6V92_02330 [Bacteroidaceae bacterium]|nr:hypothetical protein [Bacteroidaceae bacterium]